MVPSLIQIRRILTCDFNSDFNFFCFWSEILFLGKFGPKKSQFVSLSENLVPNLNLENLMVMFTLSFFEWKYPFFGNLFQKIEIIYWSLNLERRLIWICTIQWWFLFFYFLVWKYPFWLKMARKFKIVSLGWNIVPRLFQNVKFDGNVHFFSSRPFLASFVQKISLVFWCDLINLLAVHLQRLEASGFSYSVITYLCDNGRIFNY